MVIGATASGIFLTNPVEHVTECVLQDILCSPSVLLVRSEDVHQHWTKGCDLNSLLNNTDSRWTEMNVIGKREKLLSSPLWMFGNLHSWFF